MSEVPESVVQPVELIVGWLNEFSTALASGDAGQVSALFAPKSYWRDLVAFTWNIHTAHGPEEIEQRVRATASTAAAARFEVDGEATVTDAGIDGWFTFETSSGNGRGYVRLNEGKCVTMLTALRSLKGFEEKTGRNFTREAGTDHGAFKHRKNWLEKKQERESELGVNVQPEVLIVGGGQGGIALAARLTRLEVPNIVIDVNERPGDAWRNRYRSLCLHDPVWYDHLPYLPFPDHWPIYTPKDKIGDWLEMYTKVMELNYWTRSVCKQASYDDDTGKWKVVVERDGKKVTIEPRQLVLATGMSGVPKIPDVPGISDFKGSLIHSSKHTGGEGFSGKRCVVVGSNNSAHDICADLWENDADVTMVQRSSSLVAKSETLLQGGVRKLYSESAVQAGMTTDDADLILASIPYATMPDLHRAEFDKYKVMDAELYEGLDRAGFKLDFGEDGSGLYMKYLRRGSGYYIDVGASQLIVDGEIKLKSGVEVERVNADSVSLTDGTQLPADLIVFATGYGPMTDWAEQLISPEVAKKVGKCWGLGSDTTYDPGPWEGELRNMWKPVHQQGLWFHGGNLQQSRHYSLYLALQIKARFEGLATPVYGMPDVHHEK